MRYRSRRRVHLPDGDPLALRRRHPRRPLPLPVERGLLLPHARPEGRDARARRTTPRACCSRRSATRTRCCSSSRRRSTARSRRRSPEGDYTVAARQGAASRARAPTCTVIAYGAMVPIVRGGREARRGEGHRRRDRRPAHALPAGRRRPCSSPSARPAGWSSSTRRRGPAASAPRSPRSSPRRRSSTSRRRSCASPGFDTPFPYTLEHLYMPDERRVLDAIENVAGWA